MQSILAILEIIKTAAAICTSDKLEQRSQQAAKDILYTCLNMVQRDMDAMSLAQNDIKIVK